MQLSRRIEPAGDPYRPSAHREQYSARVSPRAGLKRPAEQLKQSGGEVTPVVVTPPYLPFGQTPTLQFVLPSSSWYDSPAVQFPQVERVAAPVAALAVPLGHLRQSSMLD